MSRMTNHDQDNSTLETYHSEVEIIIESASKSSNADARKIFPKWLNFDVQIRYSLPAHSSTDVYSHCEEVSVPRCWRHYSWQQGRSWFSHSITAEKPNYTTKPIRILKETAQGSIPLPLVFMSTGEWVADSASHVNIGWAELLQSPDRQLAHASL